MTQPIARRALHLLAGLGALLAVPPAALADSPAAPAASLESLGLTPSGPAVRERAGWRPPKLILVAPYLHDALAQLKDADPGARFIELPQASAREIAGADATLGVCRDRKSVV